MSRSYWTLATVVVIGLVLVCTGCATRKTAPAAGVIQNLDTERSDYNVMASVEGTGKVTKVLGLSFPFFAARAYVPGSIPVMSNPITGPSGGGYKAIGMATHEALNKVPEADTMIPMTYVLEKNGVPIIFRTFQATVRSKAIKIKTDGELK